MQRVSSAGVGLNIDRRQFLRLGIGSLWSLLAASSSWGATGRRVPGLYRWCPRFPIAREIWVVPFAGDVEEGMLLESALGLMARAALHGHWRTLLYEDLANDGYRRWFDAYCRAHRPRLIRMSLDEAVNRLRETGLIRGYLLYRYDADPRRPMHTPGPAQESVNVATALAGYFRGVLVSESLVARADSLGLQRLADLRERTEAWCLAQADGHPEAELRPAVRFSRQVLGTSDPKSRVSRHLMIALDAFVCSGRGEVYERALARCHPDSPVVGWGTEAEDAQTIPSSRWGLFQTATNWCHNLPVFSGEAPAVHIPAPSLRSRHPVRWADLDWGDGRHHVSFVMSDGDNVQWLMGNFVGGSEAPSYFGHPRRGTIPCGWGLPVPSLAQLSPRTLAEVFARATPNDDFVLYSGGGYFYPDLYGRSRRSQEALQRHAERLRAYMELTGVRLLAFNFQDWDSPAALAACEALARRLPGLLGILAFQYYPYSAGEGAVRWVPGAQGDEVPVVSCRLCIWAQTGRPRDTTPAGVAAWLNRLPTAQRNASEECFTWVVAHAWSRFRKADPGAPPDAEEQDVPQDRDAPGTERGYSPILWTAERLAPQVRVVTPQELLLRLRLRLRPEATLARWLQEVQRRRPCVEGRRLLEQAASLIPQTRGSHEAASRCFELLRAAYHLAR